LPIGLLVSLLVLAVLLCGGGAAAIAVVTLGRSPIRTPLSRPATFPVHGRLIIGGGCSGFGYSDIGDGTEVTLTDDAGKVLSVGQLSSAGGCLWNFTLPDVPVGGKFYGITISHRGTVHFTEKELRAGVTLSLGS
jgi:hypothetical protein